MRSDQVRPVPHLAHASRRRAPYQLRSRQVSRRPRRYWHRGQQVWVSIMASPNPEFTNGHGLPRHQIVLAGVPTGTAASSAGVRRHRRLHALEAGVASAAATGASESTGAGMPGILLKESLSRVVTGLAPRRTMVRLAGDTTIIPKATKRQPPPCRQARRSPARPVGLPIAHLHRARVCSE